MLKMAQSSKLRLSNQMEKKRKLTQSGNGVGDKKKNNTKFGKYK